MARLLTHWDDLQWIVWGNTDFSWFTEDTYSKSRNDKRGGHTIAAPFDVVKAAFSYGHFSPKAELYALTWACTLVKVKIADICTDITQAFGVNLNFGKL